MSADADLLEPDAYGIPLGSKIELRETHISRVFLLERDVYKVKKAVDLGFLDFRTLEQRRAACEAEVRLNRRLAPSTYLGVAPIRMAEGGHLRVASGDGPIVDWAVHMRRHPDAERADVRLAAGALDHATIDAVAARIAVFHASARTDDAIAKFGDPSVVLANVEENAAQTRETLGRYLEPHDARALLRWQSSFVRARQARFHERSARGRIRDGHGDLRLEHVYLAHDGEITILDCIEFNDRFRYADVAADIAFLSMDLRAHERVDLAERLLASYARATDDYDLYELVDFYEGYRAFVRGKVSSMLADDARAGTAARDRAAADARHYFLLALSAARRQAVKPSVVAIGGLIASGKSTLADRLAAEIGAVVIDADRTRKGMIGVAPTEAVHDAPWRGAYDLGFTDRVYAEMFRRAAIVLASGRTAILDASFRSSEKREQARSLAETSGVPFRFALCRAPDEVCRARLRARETQHGVSDGRLAIFDDFRASFEAVDDPAAILVDTTEPLAANVAKLRDSIEVWPSAE